MLIFAISTIFATGLGQALIFLLVATIGFILNRKSKQIHVLVNSRLDEALTRIALLENSLGIERGAPIPSREARINQLEQRLTEERSHQDA